MDTYYNVLETVSTSGQGRALVAVTGPTPNVTGYTSGDVPVVGVWGGACVRVRVWQDAALCAGRRGLLRLHKRRLAPAAHPAHPAPAQPLHAIAILHPLLTLTGWSPSIQLRQGNGS